MRAPKEVIIQGKYECAAASLALLLGHTLFNVKRVMSYNGWRNDSSGAGNGCLRETAREFGRDLVYGGPHTFAVLGDDLPDSMLTVPSLNYPKRYHGVSWFNREVVDPNFGLKDRKFWYADAPLKDLGVTGILIVTNRLLSKTEHSDIQWVRRKGSDEDIRQVVKWVAG